MKITTTPNKAAFPRGKDAYGAVNDGMTIREHAAITFMAAILANPASYDKDGNWRDQSSTAAELAVELADDIINELARK